MKGRKLSEELKDKIVVCYKSGFETHEVAKKFNVSRTSVYTALRERGEAVHSASLSAFGKIGSETAQRNKQLRQEEGTPSLDGLEEYGKTLNKAVSEAVREFNEGQIDIETTEAEPEKESDASVYRLEFEYKSKPDILKGIASAFIDAWFLEGEK